MNSHSTSGFKILFVTAHPDDESLWAGGTIAAISQFQSVDAYVMCMTGKHHPFRNNEFEQAMAIAQPAGAVVLDNEIPEKGGIPLDDIRGSFKDGLACLNMDITDFDLVVSHSHYGDEHTHHQHKQLFGACRRIAAESNVPFACFAFMPLPYVQLCPILTDARRDKGLHFLTLATCTLTEHPLAAKLSEFPPTHFIQFKVASERKSLMLCCYKSINIDEHQKGYSAWDSDIEGFYLFDEQGLAPFKAMYDEMERPFKPLDCIF